MLTRLLKKNALFRFPQLPQKHVFFLNEGFLKVATMNREGKEAIKYLVASGAWFGEISLLYEQECMEDFCFCVGRFRYPPYKCRRGTVTDVHQS